MNVVKEKSEKEPKNIDYHIKKISKKISLNDNQIDELKEIAKKFKLQRENIKQEFKAKHNMKMRIVPEIEKNETSKFQSILNEVDKIQKKVQSLKLDKETDQKYLANLQSSLNKENLDKEKMDFNYLKDQSSSLYKNILQKDAELDECLKRTRKLTKMFLKEEAEDLYQEIKELQTIDICILLDLTGSMIPWIKQARSSLIQIINQTKNIFGSSEIRCSFIGYRDIDNLDKRYEITDFFNGIEKVRSKLLDIAPINGLDDCEDVNGALQQVLTLKWGSKHRFLFHVLDSPCHNSKYNGINFLRIKLCDNHPSGLESDAPFYSIFERFVEMKIRYSIIPLDNSTDFMINKFKDHYYEIQKKRKDKENYFKVLPLEENGKSVENFLKSSIKTIVSTLTKDMYETISKKPLKRNSTIEPEFNVGMKGDTNLYQVKLISSEIPYDPAELDKKLNQYSFQVKEIDVAKIVFENKPFAKGTFSSAHKASIYFEISKNSEKKMVLKKPLRVPTNPKKYFYGLLQINTITKQLAKIFTEILNSLQYELDIQKGITFIDMFVVADKEKKNFYVLEPDLGPNFKKFTNNALFYDSTYDITIQSLHAFSHWSFEYTNHRFMVTDLQGSTSILTDSTLNTNNEYFVNYGDLGLKGIASFFATHQCSKICQSLGLKPKKEIKNRLKDIIPKINYSTMTLECENTSCLNDLEPGETIFCSSCKKEIKKHIEKKECLICKTKFEYYPLEYKFRNKEYPLCCEKCSKN